MILVVDAGNSRIKWAYSNGGADSVLEEAHAGQAFYGSPDQRSSLLGETLETTWRSQPPPTRVVVSNVAGEGVEEILKAWVTRHWRLDLEFVRSQPKGWGIVNAYKRPSDLGVDRWVGMVAAHNETKEGCCIVDGGTAVTIDGVTKHGRHIGGVIMPGLALMRRSLLEHTSKIGISDGAQAPGLASDTAAAVSSGTSFALIAGIQRALDTIEATLGSSATTYITGGDASFIGATLCDEHIIDHNLILKGLVIVAENEP